MHTRLSCSLTLLTAVSVSLLSSGCQSVTPRREHGAFAAAAAVTPKELCKVVLPQYTIEPPDILMIEAVRVVPRPPVSSQ